MAQRFRSTAADEDNGANLDGTTTYAYDDINRLTEAIYPGNQATSHRRVTYAYNDSGDRTSLMRWTGSPGSWSQDGSTVSSTYDSAGRLTAAGGVNYCHDANGNQTRRAGSTCSTGGDTFGWDTHNRFLNYNPSSGSGTAYGYNGDGVRVKKTVGSAVTHYFQDVAGGLPRVAAELPTSTYVWTFYVYGLNLIAQVGDDGAARYYHYDGNGNVRAISDAAGAVVERYDYDAFGSLRNTPLGATNDRRYTGEQHDAESEYTFLRARYYDPALGRFISKDPFDGVLANPQTQNAYIYVLNNPILHTDPSGRIAPLVLAGMIWAAVEFGLSVWDAIEAADTLSNPTASAEEKLLTGGAFLAGLAAPGGGYSHWVKQAESVVKRTGRHAGEFLKALGSKPAQITRTIRSLEQRRDEHLDKISNPEKYIPNWAKLDERQKAGLLSHWKTEVDTFIEQISINSNILKARGG